MESFNSVGVKISKNGRNEAELNDRSESSVKLYHSVNNPFVRKDITKKAKLIEYKTNFRPISLVCHISLFIKSIAEGLVFI